MSAARYGCIPKVCGRYTLFNRAEDRAPQGCDLSAAASADWRGGNAVPLRASLPESDKSWGRRGKAPEDTSVKSAS